MSSRRPVLSAIVCGLVTVTLCGTGEARELFREDFSRFPPGWLSAPVGQLNGAIQEYHFLPHRGVLTTPWHNPIVYLDSWVVGDEDGKPYLEQHLQNTLPKLLTPLFITGDPAWDDVRVEAKVRPLLGAGKAGLVIRYQTSRNHYFFGFDGNRRVVFQLKRPIEKQLRVVDVRELGAAPATVDPRRSYVLAVETVGVKLRGFIDGKLVLEVTDPTIRAGRAGVAADEPTRFQDFVVTASDAAAKRIATAIARRNQTLQGLRDRRPGMRLWQRFKTPGFGAGRNVRFGDLDGDGQIDMLIAQNIPRVRGDAFDHISALTAMRLDGQILWQLGRPDARNTLLTNDTPFQIHDVDGDGSQDVVLIKDFKLQILDGRTGKVKRWTWMPEAPVNNKERPYELNSGDSIAFFRVSDKAGRKEILIKDRYRSFWMLDDALKVLWKGEGQTGHYPYPYDFDGDGKDEIVMGFSLRDQAGRKLWSHDDALKDHTDAISAGNYTGDPKAEPRVYACGSDEGFLIFAKDGRVLKHVRIGHAQTQSVGDYLPARKGLEIMVANFWKSPGIVTLFDYDGNILRQDELISGSSHLLPVNWDGSGQELALLSGSVHEGGLIDGDLRRVVVFPDDGHPDLAAAVANVTGDERDEIILWNTEEVWIYTQDQPFTGKRIYAPSRNPSYNDSNYRAVVSMPGWRTHDRARDGN